MCCDFGHTKSACDVKNQTLPNPVLLYYRLAWSFFASNIEDIRENIEYINEIYEVISIIENEKKVKFPEGYDPDVRCIRLTLDPIRSIPRPFVFYVVCIALINLL